MLPSLLTLSILPGYERDDEEVTLTATATDGAHIVVSRTLRSMKPRSRCNS